MRNDASPPPPRPVLPLRQDRVVYLEQTCFLALCCSVPWQSKGTVASRSSGLGITRRRRGLPITIRVGEPLLSSLSRVQLPLTL